MIQSVSSFEETASIIGVKRHVLHLWVKKFPLLQPKKSASGELGFGARDISFAKGLKVLLIDEQKTIPEAQKMLNERGISYISAYGKEKSTQQEITRDARNNHSENIPYHKMHFKKKNTLSIAEQFKNVFKNQAASAPPEKHFEDKIGTELLDNKNMMDDDMSQTSVKSVSMDTGTHFEDNWRDFMHNKGKIASKDEIIAKNRDMQETDDLIFVDDSVNLDNYIDVTQEDDNIVAFGEYGVVTQPKEVQSKKQKRDYPHNIIYQDEDSIKQTNARLSVKNQEKMQHLLAKLDILKSELTVTREVMTSTLKAFGYSGFGDAYSRHDNKSAY